MDVVRPGQRRVVIKGNDRGEVGGIKIEPCDVFVMQRPTHAYHVNMIRFLIARGTAVVVDIDDDLRAIHPGNAAFIAMHPKSLGVRHDDGTINMHSWLHMDEACRQATLVTVSTAALLPRYAPHGRGVVIDNYLPEHYYTVPHTDSDLIGWPASLHSHPDDPSAVGSAVSRLVARGRRFEALSSPGFGQAFGLEYDPPGGHADVPLLDWPAAVARYGIGIAPLADTRFNLGKSRLKALEMAGCGVPFVASPRAEYARFHAEGAGLLAGRPKDWYRTLERLAQNPDERAELAAAGRAVADRNRLTDHVWRHMDAWTRAGLSLAREHYSLLGVRRPARP